MIRWKDLELKEGKIMRPFTKAIFEQEGKAIVGSRWTIEQVQQAYEKADELLDLFSEFKSFKPVQELGLHKLHADLEYALHNRLQKNLPDEAVQFLSLSVFSNLLDKGTEIMKHVAWLYENTPNNFKNTIASSKQAFLKDRFFLKKVPVHSFPSFKTGENPAFSQDEKFSKICADLYPDAHRITCLSKGYTPPANYAAWLRSSIGDKFNCEMLYLQIATYKLKDKKLGKPAPVATTILTKKQNTL